MDIVATFMVAFYDIFFKVECYFIIMMKINVTIISSNMHPKAIFN